jgi:Uma2 family endonuclease
MIPQLVFESTESITQQEFAAFAAGREGTGDPNHYELLNGRVVMNPPAGYPHGKIGNLVQVLLGNFVLQRRSGEVFDSSQGFELPSGDTVEPDHSFVSQERWASANPVMGQFLRVVPDLVVEVLSTRTASQDRGEKKAVYERNGVREYWLIDPRARNLTVFALKEGLFGKAVTLSEEERFESNVLEGLAFLVRQLLP